MLKRSDKYLVSALYNNINALSTSTIIEESQV